MMTTESLTMNSLLYHLNNGPHLPPQGDVEPVPERLNVGRTLPADVDVEPEPERLNIGKMDQKCPHCQALLFKDEKTLSFCCSGGKVKLPKLRQPTRTSDIAQLLQNQQVLDNIRKYNCCFEILMRKKVCAMEQD